jgi:hypothetical protein
MQHSTCIAHTLQDEIVMPAVKCIVTFARARMPGDVAAAAAAITHQALSAFLGSSVSATDVATAARAAAASATATATAAAALAAATAPAGGGGGRTSGAASPVDALTGLSGYGNSGDESP